MLGHTHHLGELGSLQRLRPELAATFEAAFVAAEPDLRQWMPAASHEQEHAAAFIAGCVEAFVAGSTYAYAMVSPDGDATGYINATPEPDHAVVAYWVRPDRRGRGLAPQAVRVLSDAVFATLSRVERMHAHLDAANAASRRVLEKAGFHHHQTFTRPPRTSSESDTEWLYIRMRPGI